MIIAGIYEIMDHTIQEENIQLKRAVEELSFLNDLSKSIGGLTNSHEIVQTIVRKSVRAINSNQGSITLVSDEEEMVMKTLVRTMVSHDGHQAFSLSQGLLGWMYNNRKAMAVNDPGNDNRFKGFEWEEDIHSIACVPLLVKSKLIGVLSIYNKKDINGFDEEDLRLLTIIASQSAQIIENARLMEEEQKLIRLKEEGKLARDIQINLLPKKNPELPGFDIAGKSDPALNVGGDYFDFITVENSKLVICLGDISGKGMPAALLMSNLQATIRSQSTIADVPEVCISRSNNLLFYSTDMNKYATFFYTIIDPDTSELYYTNAGHNPPMLFNSKSEMKELKAGGPVLGFLDNMEYKSEKIKLAKGDLLAIFSDGITEAMDAGENEFGEERLENLISENKDKSSEDLINVIFDEVKKFSGNLPQSDDMTIVILKKV